MNIYGYNSSLGKAWVKADSLEEANAKISKELPAKVELKYIYGYGGSVLNKTDIQSEVE